MAFLKNWEGTYLHCDGYSGYKKLKNVTLCGCLVHAKRKFHEAWKIQTAIANNLKPLYYLEYVFEQIQMNNMLQVSDLLPWSAKIPEKCKNLKTPQHQ